MSRAPVVTFVKRWRLAFAALGAGLYAVAIVLLIWRFPDVSNLWVSIFVLGSGFFTALLALADVLVSAEEAVRDDGGDPR